MPLIRSRISQQETRDRVPPLAFMRRLKLRDRELDVKWDNVLGRWHLIRWYDATKYTPAGLEYQERDWAPVCTIQNPEGSFHDLDDYVFTWLDRADTHHVDMAEYIRNMDRYELKKEEQDRANLREEIRSFVMDHRPMVSRWRTTLPTIASERSWRTIVKP